MGMNQAKAIGRRRRQRGNVAILTAFMIVPLIGATGLAIDGARAMLVKYQLQSAIDTAALALGTTFGTQAELSAAAQEYVEQNFNVPGATVGTVNVSSSAENVTVTGSASMSTFFIKVVYEGDVNLSATTEVRRAGGGLMVAMVLDNTGSMWGGLSGTSRIEALRAASLSLTNSVFTQDEEDELKVAVVPYASMVNPGSVATSIVDMMDTESFRIKDPQDRTGLDDDELATLIYDPTDKRQWKGCVYERAGDASLDDTPPTTLKWKPMIWPIYNDNQYEVETWGMSMGQPVSSTIDPGGDRNSNAFTGPNVGCPTPITPLTGTRATVIQALNDMTAWNRGGTFSDIGMAWGVRVLTPTAPFMESNNYLDPKTAEPIWDSPRWRRAIVLMTDGDNVVYNTGNEGSRVDAGSELSDITGYGRLGEAQMTALLNTSNRNTAQTRVDERLADLCDAAKAQGITIYTVVFATSAGSDTKELFEGCASDPGKYWFAPSADSLDNAFGAIGSDLNKLRITR